VEPVGPTIRAISDYLQRQATLSTPVPSPEDQVRATLTHSGVPQRYLDARFSNWRKSPATEQAYRAAINAAAYPKNLILIGPWGTGKTRLASSVMAARVERWLEAYPSEVMEHDDEGLLTRPPFRSKFTGVPQLLDDIRRGFNYTDEADALAPLVSAPLLILDDLGREKATDWVLERLYVLIDTRYVQMRPTIVTTNYSLDTLAQRDYGAMVSRLAEDATIARMNGGDQRVAR
jgi:DNA replication protein DnaC